MPVPKPSASYAVTSRHGSRGSCAWCRCRLSFEPCYESGKAERWQIGMASGEPFAVAGLWREGQKPDGRNSAAFTQITINADHHPLMRRVHKPGDEKRSLVIIPPEQYALWLQSPSSVVACSFLVDYPAELMTATPAPKKPKQLVPEQGRLFG